MSVGPAPWRRFVIEDLPREPWRNGAGWTRTVASHSEQDTLCWRVSVADIGAAGPFSVFDGLDRTAVMVRGAGLRLAGEGQAWHFEGPGAYAQFPGELALACDAPRVPTQLWNVMVRRGRAQADLLIAEGETVALPQAPDVLVLVLRGHFQAHGADTGSLTLDTGEGLHLHGPLAPTRLTPTAPDGLLLVTALR